MAQTDADGDASGDGDDILERASEFDADDIGGCVEAEGLGGELLLDEGGDFRVTEGHGEGSGLALCDFQREAGAAKGADGEGETNFGQTCGDNLSHA